MCKKKNNIASMKEYSQKIEDFLIEHMNQSYSEVQIAEQVSGLKMSRDGDLLGSKEDVATLSHIRDALKLLMAERKVKCSLLEDFHTMQNIMQCSTT